MGELPVGGTGKCQTILLQTTNKLKTSYMYSSSYMDKTELLPELLALVSRIVPQFPICKLGVIIFSSYLKGSLSKKPLVTEC